MVASVRLGARRHARRPRGRAAAGDAGSSTSRPGSRSGACARCTPTRSSSPSSATCCSPASTTRRSGSCKARMARDFLGQVPLLGLAGHHRRRGDHAAARLHAGQGVRRARVAHRHRDRGRLGRLRDQLLLDAGERRERHLYVALWFYIATHHHRRDAAHRQLPLDPGVPWLKSYLDLRRRAGRARAVVVRAQRRRLLPDDADPRHHVLLPAEGGGAAGLLVPAVDHPLLVAGLRLHLGRPAPPAQHGAARLGADARHGLLRHALGAELGRHAQRPAHAARRVGQGARPIRSSSSSRPRVTFYGMATFEGPLLSIKTRQRARALHRLDHRPRPRRRARLERLHGGRHVLLAGAAALRDASSTARSWPTPLLDRRRFGILLYVVAMYSAGITAGADVARHRRHGPPRLPRLHRDRGQASFRCTGCAPSAARSTSSAC